MVWLCLWGTLLPAQTPSASRAKQRGATAPRAKSNPEEPYNLRGRVLASDMDRPVPDALIKFTSEPLYPPGDPRNPQTIRTEEAFTNSKGEFAVSLSPGDYNYEVRSGDYALDERARHQFTIASGKAPERLTIRMLRVAAISGVVEDADGNGLAGVRVEVANSSSLPLPKQTITGSSGRFTISSVVPGSYLLRALIVQPAEGASTAFVTTYYPGTADSFAAGEIAVNGADLPNLRLRMQRVELRSISGIVTGREANPSAAAVVVLRPIEDPRAGASLYSRLQLRGAIEDDGTFSIDGIPPGRYTATVEGGDQKRTWFPLATELVAVRDRDIDDLRMTVAPSGVFAGEFVVENGKLPKDLDGTYLNGQTAVGRASAPLKIKRDGSFWLEGVPNGTYALPMLTLPGYSVSSIELGGLKYEGSKFPFAAPGATDVLVTLTAGGALIQGTIGGSRSPDQSVTGTATAVMVSGLTDGLRYMRKATLAPSGSFTLIDLEAGKYLVCAWSDDSVKVEKLLNSDTPPVERLEQLCKTVELKKDSAESIEVHLTSLAEVTR